jgi:Cu+-exporting ATPase
MAPILSSTRARAEACLHCGTECGHDAVAAPEGSFCCHGCEAVFRVLQVHELEAFYACDYRPGVSQKTNAPRDRARFAALDDPAVAARFLDSSGAGTARATFSIPAIHCGSCVWLLERLWRLDAAIAASEVDLLRRSVRVEFDPARITLRRIAELLAAIGYEPAITAEDVRPAPLAHRRLYLQLGVAGFAFGNIMLFSIPRYANGTELDGGFQTLFDTLNISLALPVLLFSAADFFRAAWHALRTRSMAIEVPLALGLVVLFGRSVFDIATGGGEGFMDSFAGLVFFLLIGRLFQHKVFDRIAFDRTFRSFLPLSVRVERGRDLVMTPIDDLRPGDVMAVRRHEVVPADAALLEDAGSIDYAFTTGEQSPIHVSKDEIVRAGGRVASGALRLRVVRAVSHTRLAALWTNPVFAKPKTRWLTDVTAQFGAWFTVGAIALAAAGAVAWWPDARASAAVATAVLIVACPCALTLSAPITLGTAMGQLGRRGLYVKHPAVVLDMSRIDTIVFDKTGTLTVGRTAAQQLPRAGGASMDANAPGLTDAAWARVRRLAAESVHPASRGIATAPVYYRGPAPLPSRPEAIREIPGEGICGVVDGRVVAIGTAAFVERETGGVAEGPAGSTHLAAGRERGWIQLTPALRPGIDEAARELSTRYKLRLLSGDHDYERARWAALFGPHTHFRQSPEDKLAGIREAQRDGERVLMVGDGLNDAGALAAADVGIAVSDETACLAPACDAVISGDRVASLPAALRYAGRARHVVLLCFAVSIVYNAIGLALALAGMLTPLAAAILMPVSSMTVVGISAGAMRWLAGRMLPS